MKALQWRFEYKYRMSGLSADALARFLPHLGFAPDPAAAAGRGTYHVSSVYFDSPAMTDYYDKAGGFFKRKKIRGRIYASWMESGNQKVWLEAKLRTNLLTAKERILLSGPEWEMFRTGRYGELLAAREADPKTMRNIAWRAMASSVRPTVLVKYLRAPFLLNTPSPVRITFDREIVACHRQDFWYTPFVVPVVGGDEVILEIKFSSSVPHWLSDLVRAFNLNRISFSKYTEAVDALRRMGKNPLPR
ncbi:MAG: polyphosphate polymerase domain-containing protein [Patescibacteria group bacterium]|mgnify:CR=1 FL=1